MKITPIDEIEDLADGVPVLAVEGTVKFAQELKHGTSAKGVPWNKQFFVLSSGTAEIACSMWDAENNEMVKGEKVHIENTQNKKGQWNGMVKGSYQKDGERKHTLEIRANQVKITHPSGKPDNETDSFVPPDDQETLKSDPGWPEPTPITQPKPPSATPRYGMLDERQRAIIRQHSQSMALEVLKLKVTLNELTVVDLTPSKLKALADYFDEDVIGATQ